MLVIIKYSKRNLRRYLRKCIAFFLFILGILSIPLLSVVLIMPRDLVFASPSVRLSVCISVPLRQKIKNKMCVFGRSTDRNFWPRP